MGFFSTTWEGEYEGHKIEVVRKLGGHSFLLNVDGKEMATDAGIVNMGTRSMKAVLKHNEKDLIVEAIGKQGALTESAQVTVDGKPIVMKKIK
jgi:hypothetical protein